MIITRSPFRISFFGGSSDYKDFYSKNGALIIGTTIDKYVYTTIRYCPRFLSDFSVFSYSRFEVINNFDNIKNPLIRETVKSANLQQNIETHFLSDIPMRTGLGGSSSFCASFLGALSYLKEDKLNKKLIAQRAIDIERNILKESGGIQDQIWASYGGFNSIEINQSGEFYVKPMPISDEFKEYFKKHLILIYTNEQRNTNKIAKSHENKDKNNILKISKEAYDAFLKENIELIGNLLQETWEEKKKISDEILTPNILTIERQLKNLKIYGLKLLGAGGGGFILVICNPLIRNKIKKLFSTQILDFDFDKEGLCQIY